MRGFVAVAVLGLFGGLVGADEPSKTWEGTWVNKKYNTTGTLKCVAKPDKDKVGAWNATFSGVFQGRPFSYDVTFEEKKGAKRSDLSGKSKIGNHDYEWTGALTGDVLTGQYKSNSGYYGTFTLKTK